MSSKTNIYGHQVSASMSACDCDQCFNLEMPLLFRSRSVIGTNNAIDYDYLWSVLRFDPRYRKAVCSMAHRPIQSMCMQVTRNKVEVFRMQRGFVRLARVFKRYMERKRIKYLYSLSVHSPLMHHALYQVIKHEHVL